MQTTLNPSDEPAVPMPVMVAAELQDALLIALRDLQRLEGLLDHATQNLLERFDQAHDLLTPGEGAELSQFGAASFGAASQALRLAVTELQFHDMSSQLIAHISQTLQGCAFRLGAATMGVEDCDDESAGLPPMPERPNPVTQSEMDAGSVELF